MKVKTVKAWKCPECDAVSLVEDTPAPEVEDFWQCGECDEVHEDKDEAKECCRD